MNQKTNVLLVLCALLFSAPPLFADPLGSLNRNADVAMAADLVDLAHYDDSLTAAGIHAAAPLSIEGNGSTGIPALDGPLYWDASYDRYGSASTYVLRSSGSWFAYSSYASYTNAAKGLFPPKTGWVQSEGNPIYSTAPTFTYQQSPILYATDLAVKVNYLEAQEATIYGNVQADGDLNVDGDLYVDGNLLADINADGYDLLDVGIVNAAMQRFGVQTVTASFSRNIIVRPGIIPEFVCIYKTNDLVYVCGPPSKWDHSFISNQIYWHIKEGGAEGYYAINASGIADADDSPVPGAVAGDLWIALSDEHDIVDGSHTASQVNPCVDMCVLGFAEPDRAGVAFSGSCMAYVPLFGVASVSYSQMSLQVDAGGSLVNTFILDTVPRNLGVLSYLRVAQVAGQKRVMVEVESFDPGRAGYNVKDFVVHVQCSSSCNPTLTAD